MTPTPGGRQDEGGPETGDGDVDVAPAGFDPVFRSLDAAREWGFLGPGPVVRHVRHARAFARAVEQQVGGPVVGKVLDLGSGGGLPGLVMAVEWPQAHLVLLDSSSRRADFLRQAVIDCGLAGQVEVVCGRAEEVARDPDRRSSFDIVVARSFAAPAVTAECAAPFLKVGGCLAVSEPPGDPARDRSTGSGRWTVEGLAILGLEPVVATGDDFGFQLMTLRTACPERFPRRTGVPQKRPLF
jgi:16S rRNA (guanine527-N7)-methyltransferase